MIEKGTNKTELSEEDIKRRVYTLNGLPPEVIAVAFAKTSRSPDAFDKIAHELNEDKSRKFHEKWVVGYGHSSVAEHSVLSLALENVSILATKVIEDNRLASYTEKSSRYQVFNKERYFKPSAIMNAEDSGLKDTYVNTYEFIMDAYLEITDKLTDYMKKKHAQGETESERAYETRIKNLVCDNTRYILPVACLTNLGWTINARNLEYGIAKLLTHPLEEMKLIGEDVKKAALKVTPTLVKYTDYNEYIDETDRALKELSDNKLGSVLSDLQESGEKERVTLVDYDETPELKIATALMYKQSNLPYNEIKKKLEAMSEKEINAIVEESLKRAGRHDRPVRELEHVFYTFDILMDYGAFRDVQRHRMCTQTNPDFTPYYGYDVPPDLVDAGFEKLYVECMEKAKLAYIKIAKEFPKEASYILPMAYRKRLLMKINLRAMSHFIRLRSGKMGHWSYREIAQKMFDSVNDVHPFIASFINVDKS